MSADTPGVAEYRDRVVRELESHGNSIERMERGLHDLTNQVSVFLYGGSEPSKGVMVRLDRLEESKKSVRDVIDKLVYPLLIAMLLGLGGLLWAALTGKVQITG